MANFGLLLRAIQVWSVHGILDPGEGNKYGTQLMSNIGPYSYESGIFTPAFAKMILYSALAGKHTMSYKPSRVRP